MADTSLEAFRFMRDLAADVHTPEHAHAVVVTAGRDAAHLALTIVDLSMRRMEHAAEADRVDQVHWTNELSIITAAIQAWRTVYAYLPR